MDAMDSMDKSSPQVLGATRQANEFLISLLRDATPAAGSALLGPGDPAYATQVDLTFKERTGPVDAGAVDGD